MFRPFGFRVLSVVFLVVWITGAGILASATLPTPVAGLKVAARFAAVLLLLLSGIVVVGLWRADAWVGRAMDLWMLLFAGSLVTLSVAAEPRILFEPLAWVFGAIALGTAYLPVMYVKDRLRMVARWTPAVGAGHPAPPLGP
ncbi:MAG TPA: hypothetical protein VFX98_19335 [Longimicrobiaceae bacterium]|nr:hypothetical protein [Longimicrobiaceae bacterium]